LIRPPPEDPALRDEEPEDERDTEPELRDELEREEEPTLRDEEPEEEREDEPRLRPDEPDERDEEPKLREIVPEEREGESCRPVRRLEDRVVTLDPEDLKLRVEEAVPGIPRLRGVRMDEEEEPDPEGVLRIRGKEEEEEVLPVLREFLPRVRDGKTVVPDGERRVRVDVEARSEGVRSVRVVEFDGRSVMVRPVEPGPISRDPEDGDDAPPRLFREGNSRSFRTVSEIPDGDGVLPGVRVLGRDRASEVPAPWRMILPPAAPKLRVTPRTAVPERTPRARFAISPLRTTFGLRSGWPLRRLSRPTRASESRPRNSPRIFRFWSWSRRTIIRLRESRGKPRSMYRS
jgi:hypothetical protein